MKLSYRWLKEYAELPDTLTMEQLSYDLTMRTVEVEGTSDLAETYHNIVAGKILSVEAHPHADRLRVCQVEVGMDTPKQIVCGGANLEVGHYVAVTLPGSRAVWHGEGEPVVIEEAQLRGVASYGMIAGAGEIGLEMLFPAREPHIILDLTAEGVEDEAEIFPGRPLADILGLNDQILEIENKSITNRPDLWGHYGVARELAAIYHCPLRPLPEWDPKEVPSYPVSIAAPDRCHRFVAAQYTGVDARKAPLWMRVALMKVDIRSINALVDLTNYCMMAFGQPCHAYDAKHVEGGIQARRAEAGEKLAILEGRELMLSEEDLVIADSKKALGLAGVMGGKQDSILENTKETLFEVATFAPEGIRKTSQHYGVRTEASARNEKGMDSQRIDPTFALWNQLIAKIFPDAKLVAMQDCQKEETTSQKVSLTIGWLTRRLGRDIGLEEIRALLEPLGFVLSPVGEEDGGRLEVTVPTWRSTGDVSLPDDLLEEAARMIGYENFEKQYPTVSLRGPVNQKGPSLDRRLREYFAFSCGFQEITSYPWVRADAAKLAGEDPANGILIDQPPAPDQAMLRQSHVPNVLDAIVKNLRYADAFSLFEVGQVFQKGAMSPSSPDEVLPAMHREIAGAVVGTDPEELFYQLKGILEQASVSCQMSPLSFSRKEKPQWADREGWLTIECEGQEVGVMGLLSNHTKAFAGIKYQDVGLFRLNLDRLQPLESRTNQFEPLPQYPHVFQDLSLLAKEDLRWEEMVKGIGDRAVSIEFVDEYRGKQIPEGHKSVTLRLELASEEGTLTAEEIAAKRESIREALQSVGANVRDA